MDRPQPVLATRRLLLRPFVVQDAPDVKRLAGHVDVAATTLHIPHPYPDGAAEDWIATHGPRWSEGTLCSYAIVDALEGFLIGSVALAIPAKDGRAELGYWIGKPYWGRGHATEAARRLVRFGLDELGLVEIRARHMSRNPASGRVLLKIGMSHQGRRAQEVEKGGTREDMEYYAIVRPALGDSLLR
ncbi:MAG: GNAT family N-acetyltransferase [Planctomycetota bacterium]